MNTRQQQRHHDGAQEAAYALLDQQHNLSPIPHHFLPPGANNQLAPHTPHNSNANMHTNDSGFFVDYRNVHNTYTHVDDHVRPTDPSIPPPLPPKIPFPRHLPIPPQQSSIIHQYTQNNQQFHQPPYNHSHANVHSNLIHATPPMAYRDSYAQKRLTPATINTTYITMLVDRASYLSWKRGVTNTAMSVGVWPLICSAPPAHMMNSISFDLLPVYPPTCPNYNALFQPSVQEREAWDDWSWRNGLAAHIITSRIDASIEHLVPQPIDPITFTRQTACDMWLALESHFGILNYTFVEGLTDHMALLRLGTGIEQYIKAFTDIKVQLENAGSPLPHEKIAKAFTNGLPSNLSCWQPLIDKYRELRRTNPYGIDFNNMCNHARAIFVDSQTAKAGVPRFIYTNESSESFINPYSRSLPQKPYPSTQTSSQPNSSYESKNCTNCKKLGCIRFSGHTEDECVQPGGGDEGNFAKFTRKPPNIAKVPDTKGGGSWKGKEKEKANVIEDFPTISANNTETANVVYATNPDTIFCYPGAIHEHSYTINELNLNGKESTNVGYNENTTILDTGATSHIFCNRSIFHTYDTSQSCDVRTANCGILKSHARGLVVSKVKVDDTSSNDTLNLGFRNSLHAPDVPVNIVSVGRLMESKFHVLFGSTMAKIFLPPGPDGEPFKHFVVATKVGRLFS